MGDIKCSGSGLLWVLTLGLFIFKEKKKEEISRCQKQQSWWCVCSYKRGRGSRVAVWVPPNCPVDVYVLDKQGHQQIQKEQELKQQATVQWQLWDPRVTHRLRSNEGREGGGRQTDRITAPMRGHN